MLFVVRPFSFAEKLKQIVTLEDGEVRVLLTCWPGSQGEQTFDVSLVGRDVHIQNAKVVGVVVSCSGSDLTVRATSPRIRGAVIRWRLSTAPSSPRFLRPPLVCR